MRAAYLLTWNPAKFDWDEKEIASLSRRSADGKTLRFEWSSGKSLRPAKGDRVFLTKLGRAGRGIFASGTLTRDAYEGESDYGCSVRARWDVFLDPRDAANLLDPASTGVALFRKQMWAPQMSGTSIHDDVAVELEQAWTAHVARRRETGGAHDDRVQHTFRLRHDADATFSLPPDLTMEEARRLGDYLRTLVIDAEPAPATRSGLGPSTRRPTGRRISLPSTVRVAGSLRGGATDGERVGSGAGHVDVGLRLASDDAATELLLPAGLVMISKSTGVQNGILVQPVLLRVPPQTTKAWVLAMYCANQGRHPADATSEFELGPVVTDDAFLELVGLLAGKVIPEDRTTAVQRAVWEVTDGGGLTPESREMVASL